MWYFPHILSTITGKPRYIIQVKWSNKSWTHNVFRVYELVFGRKYGIRAEMSTLFDGDTVTYSCHSWESVFALLEMYIRRTLSFKLWIPIRVSVPILQTPQGMRFFASPYIFAIAFDAATVGTTASASPQTVSHTVTGTDPLLFVGCGCMHSTTAPTVSAVSYAAVGMTSPRTDVQGGARTYPWLLGAASTGTNDVSVTWSAGTNERMNSIAQSYSGSQSSSTADANNGLVGTTSTGDKNVTVTTVAEDCWIAGVGINRALSGVSITALQTSRGTSTVNPAAVSAVFRGEDTNGPLAAGNNDVGFNIGGTSNVAWALSFVSFAPEGGGAVVKRLLTSLGAG